MHAHRPAYPSTSKVLGVSLFITAGYILITLIAGVKAHSLALLSEAGHNVSDFLALLLSWVAVYLGTRPPTATKTFGYHRSGVLAAFVNALSLVVVAIYIFVEAAHRMVNPVGVHHRPLIVRARAAAVAH